jgi:hypothetical protein
VYSKLISPVICRPIGVDVALRLVPDFKSLIERPFLAALFVVAVSVSELGAGYVFVFNFSFIFTSSGFTIMMIGLLKMLAPVELLFWLIAI